MHQPLYAVLRHIAITIAIIALYVATSLPAQAQLDFTSADPEHNRLSR